MNCIKIVNDEDFGLEKVELNNPKVRYGARGIVVRADGKIAIFYKQKMNEYKLPGGGIDEGEDAEIAFTRECLEEVGCDVKIIQSLGYTEENKGKTNFKQVSYVFVGEVVKDYKTLNVTEKEKAEGAQLLWMKPEDALKIMKENVNKLKASPYDEKENLYATQFVALRDMCILEYYVNLCKKYIQIATK